MDMIFSEFADKIKKVSESLRTEMKRNLKTIDSEIEIIINAEEKNINYIEKILDILLDYAHLSVGKKQFNKLTDYYATFNKENAGFYKKEYDEFLKEE
ncbi:MAG: hypothetical protein ABIC91_02300 [Nanoarchaeota archaeon]|nr:hypothetical protein [Nanoarchaeota archaeon]MBU1030131.1 hypothetical protein [Nanoarchaeota archaeon]MBU1850745.1 hypothetical protein [Nanoarchaeota archaeon]